MLFIFSPLRVCAIQNNLPSLCPKPPVGSGTGSTGNGAALNAVELDDHSVFILNIGLTIWVI